MVTVETHVWWDMHSLVEICTTMTVRGYVYATISFLFQAMSACLIKHVFLLSPFTKSADITFWRYCFLPIFCVISMKWSLSPLHKPPKAKMLRGFKKFEDCTEDEVGHYEEKHSKTSYILLLWIGVFFAVSSLMLTSSISHITVTESQVIFGTKAFFVLILSMWFLKHKFSYLEFFGILLSFVILVLYSLPTKDEAEIKRQNQVILFHALGINLQPGNQPDSETDQSKVKLSNNYSLDVHESFNRHL